MINSVASKTMPEDRSRLDEAVKQIRIVAEYNPELEAEAEEAEQAINRLKNEL